MINQEKRFPEHYTTAEKQTNETSVLTELARFSTSASEKMNASLPDYLCTPNKLRILNTQHAFSFNKYSVIQLGRMRVNWPPAQILKQSKKRKIRNSNVRFVELALMTCSHPPDYFLKVNLLLNWICMPDTTKRAICMGAEMKNEMSHNGSKQNNFSCRDTDFPK